MDKLDISDVLKRAERLPSLPLAVQEVIRSFDDERLDAASLAQKISQDQGLAAKVLRVANSPFYGLSGEIGSLQEAVVVLGFHTIRTLATAAGIVSRFQLKETGGFDQRAFWQHSVGTAVCARVFAKRLKMNQEIAFTAGLLHDIGRMILAACCQPEFAKVIAHQKQTGCTLLAAERAGLGTDHAEIGAETVRQWKFPEQIQTVIRRHHVPDDEPVTPLADLVHIADEFCHCLEGICRELDLVPRLAPGAWRRLGLNWREMEGCLPEIEQLKAGASLLLAA